MKILTWNLGLYSWCKYYKKFNLKLNGVKVENEYFQKQYSDFVADFIKKHNLDICFLQEFSTLEDVEILRSLLKNDFADYKILDSWYHKHSILVLSKSDILLEKINETSFYKVDSLGIKFLPIHLNSFSAVKRYNQLMSIEKSLDDVDCILGDTNFWSYKNYFLFNKDRLSYKLLIGKSFEYVENKIGYTSKFFLNFDRVFYKGKYNLVKTEVIKTSKKSMDHYPVLFIIEKDLSIEDFEKILRKVWSKETCYEIYQKDWSEELPELGQCYISARLFQEFFGGDILKVKDRNNESHFWNRLSNIEYDFTINQYKNGKGDLNLENIKIVKEDSDNKRLNILRDRFNNFRLENY